MTKRNQEIDVDAGAEFEAFQTAEASNTNALNTNTPLDALIVSGIVTVTKEGILWREGHIEHLAREYAHSPSIAQRDYANDLIIAQGLDAEKFAALVEQARGEAE